MYISNLELATMTTFFQLEVQGHIAPLFPVSQEILLIRNPFKVAV